MKKSKGNQGKCLAIGVVLVSILSWGIDPPQCLAEQIQVEQNSDGTLSYEGTNYIPVTGLRGLEVTQWSDSIGFLLVISLVSGAFGGAVPALIDFIANERTNKPKNSQESAVLRRKTTEPAADRWSEEYQWNWWVVVALCFVGALAAPPATYFLKPPTMYGFIALSIITGSAGTAIFTSLQERVVGSLNRAKDIARREVAEETVKKQRRSVNASALETLLNEVETEADKIIKEIEEKTIKVEENDGQILRFPSEEEPEFKLKQELINQVFKPLNKIKAFDPELAEPILGAFGNLREQLVNKGETEANDSALVFKKSQTLEPSYLEEVKRTIAEAEGKVNSAKQGN